MSGELEVIDQQNAVAVFTTLNGIKPYLEKIKQHAKEELDVILKDFDINNESHRKKIISLSYKVKRSKKFIDDVGKKLKDEMMQNIKPIDPNRKLSRDFLDDLANNIRKPVTEFEENERKRIQNIIGRLDALNEIIYKIDLSTLDSNQLKEYEHLVSNTKITDDLGEYKEKIELAKIKSGNVLVAEQKRREEEEKQRLIEEARAKEEQERLRKEREERIRAEAIARAKAEAEAKARIEAERIEREKQRAIELAERMEREKKEAERRARILAERAKQERLEAEARAKREAELAEQRRLHDIERAKQEEILRARAEAERIKAEKARRLADIEHKRKINNEILQDIIHVVDVSEAKAKEFIIAVSRGKIRNIKVEY